MFGNINNSTKNYFNYMNKYYFKCRAIFKKVLKNETVSFVCINIFILNNKNIIYIFSIIIFVIFAITMFFIIIKNYRIFIVIIMTIKSKKFNNFKNYISNARCYLFNNSNISWWFWCCWSL